jgi:chromatin remodeling complex protein RSC6
MSTTVEKSHVMEGSENMESSLLDVQFNLVSNKVNSLIKDLQSVKKTLRILEKNAVKNQKKLDKKKNKKKSTSAIHKLRVVQPKLLTFMNGNLGKDEEKLLLVSRAQALRSVSKYIKEKGLQNPEAKKFFKPDTTLVDMLCIDKDTEYKFLDLNKHLTHLLKVE